MVVEAVLSSFLEGAAALTRQCRPNLMLLALQGRETKETDAEHKKGCLSNTPGQHQIGQLAGGGRRACYFPSKSHPQHSATKRPQNCLHTGPNPAPSALTNVQREEYAPERDECDNLADE